MENTLNDKTQILGRALSFYFFASNFVKQTNKPLAVLYYNDENEYSRNRALGMSYLNRLIIEENMQLECYGVLDPVSIIPAETSNHIINLLNCLLRRIEDEAIVHVIISDDFGLKSYNKEAFHRFSQFLKSIWRVWSKEIIITRIGSQRLECVRKEQYQNFHREGGKVNTTIQTNYFDGGVDVSQYETVAYKSIGDDIEDFYNRIKMNQIYLINRTEEKTYLTTVMLQQIFSLDPSNSSKLIVRTFHLSMITNQEENEMDKICTPRYKNTTHELLPGYSIRVYAKGLKHDKFTNKTAIYINEENYALSLCARKTFYISNDSHNKKRILFDIEELDPPRRRIFQSYFDSETESE